MTVYYDYKTIIPGGWDPPNYKEISFCVRCEKPVDKDSKYFKKYQLCRSCYELMKDYEE
jgi:hypothetical protein